eukprot:29029-Pelagococcus_subviridis.AAC.4
MRRERKSLRNRVHHADAVVWGPVRGEQNAPPSRTPPAVATSSRSCTPSSAASTAGPACRCTRTRGGRSRRRGTCARSPGCSDASGPRCRRIRGRG